MTRVKSIIVGTVVGAAIAACGTIYFGSGFHYAPSTTETFHNGAFSGSITLTAITIDVPPWGIAIVCLGAVTGGLAAAGLSVIRRQHMS
jgi:hypothetical protein